MCHEVNASKVILEHHLSTAKERYKSGDRRGAKDYLKQNNISREEITWKYHNLKPLLKD